MRISIVTDGASQSPDPAPRRGRRPRHGPGVELGEAGDAGIVLAHAGIVADQPARARPEDELRGAGGGVRAADQHVAEIVAPVDIAHRIHAKDAAPLAGEDLVLRPDRHACLPKQAASMPAMPPAARTSLRAAGRATTSGSASALSSAGSSAAISRTAASSSALRAPRSASLAARVPDASVPDASVFHSGRQFAAWLGLVPRQHSSGGKHRLGHLAPRRALPPTGGGLNRPPRRVGRRSGRALAPGQLKRSPASPSAGRAWRGRAGRAASRQRRRGECRAARPQDRRRAWRPAWR